MIKDEKSNVWMNCSEFARLVGVTRQTIYKRVSEGNLETKIDTIDKKTRLVNATAYINQVRTPYNG